MSVPTSPFNIFSYFKSETFEAASQDTTYNILKRWIQDDRDDCQPYGWPKSAQRQPWEMPEDTAEMTPVTPHCQTCFDEYEEDGFTVRRRTCNAANWYSSQSDCEAGITSPDNEDFGNSEYKWITEECVATVKSHMIKETPPNPSPLPSGWRVTSSGHLTNLPEDLEVTDKTDALKNGVYVINEIGGRYTKQGENWTPNYVREPLVSDQTPKINPPVVNAMPTYSYPLPTFEVSAPCVWKELKDSNYNQNIAHIVSEQDCENNGWIAYTYSPSTQTFGTLQEIISNAKGENYLNKFYWWLESPLFTTACPNHKYKEYMKGSDAAGVIDYWDDTKCQNLKAGESEESNSTLPIVIMGSVAVIVGASFLFNKGGV